MASLTVRRLHTYLGICTAPSVVFFALSGALQLFHLHEPHGSYQPLPLFERLGSLHKDQVFTVPRRHAAAHATPGVQPVSGAAAAKPPSGDDDDEREGLGTSALKWIFLLVALALATTSSLGVYMAFSQTRRKRVPVLLLAVGCLVPVGLLLLP